MRRFILAVSIFFLVSISCAEAQGLDQKTIAAWVDGVEAELKKAGASDVSHGALTYDAATGAFALNDIKAKFSKKSSKAATDADKTSLTKVERDEKPLVLSIAKITATKLAPGSGDNMWQAEQFRIEDVRLASGGDKGSALIDIVTFDALEAPQKSAAQLGDETTNTLAALVQGMSAKAISLNKFSILGDSKKKDAAHLDLNQVKIESFVKGVAGTLTIAGGSGVASETSDTKTKTLKKSIGGSLKKDFDEDSENEDDDNGEERKKPSNLTAQLGAVRVQALDLGVYADFFTRKPKNAGKDLPLYSSASVASFSARTDDDFEISTGAFTTKNVRINVPSIGVMGFFSSVDGSLDAKNETEKATANKEMFQRIKEWSVLTTTGMFEAKTLSVKTPEGKASVARISGTELGRSIGAMNFETMALTSPGFNGSIERITFKDINYKDFYQGIFDQMGAGNDTPDYTKLEGQLPTVGLIEAVKLNLQSKNEPPLLVDRFSFELGSWIKFVPSRMRILIEKAVIPSSAYPDMDSPNFKDLGYDKAELSADIVFKIDQSAKTASLSPVKLDAAEAGSVSTELVLGGIEDNMLGADGLMDPIGSLGSAKFEKVALRIDNGSFLDRYVAWKAKNDKKTPDAVKKTLADKVKKFTAMLPTEDDKKKANAAVDAFFEKPKNFSIVITPKASLGLLEFQIGMVASQAATLKKLNVDIQANQGAF